MNMRSMFYFKTLLFLVSLSFLLSSCNEDITFSKVIPEVGSVTVTSSNPSHQNLSLSYSGVKGRYDSYCILENSTQVQGCNWIRGVLPATYTFTSVSSNISLSVYIKNVTTISQVSQTSSVVSIPYLNSMIQFLKPNSSSSVNTAWQGYDSRFGYNVDTDGTTYVASSYSENSQGAVYIFEEISGTMTLVQTLELSFVAKTGQSLSLDGDTLVIADWNGELGCSGIYTEIPEGGCDSFVDNAGSVYVYRKILGVWTFEAFITSPDPDEDDSFGYSVSISGDSLAISSFKDDGDGAGINPANNDNATDTGAVYLYRRNGSTWVLEESVKANSVSNSDYFGFSLSLSNDTLVVGAYGEDSSTTGVNSTPNESASSAGAAYVFVRDGNGDWTQQAYLKASNTGASDVFGFSVDIDGDVIVVGAHAEDSNSTTVNGASNNLSLNSGAAYVFRRSGVVWSQDAFLKSTNIGTTKASDQFGFKVSIDGTRILIAANGEDSSTTGVNSVADEATSASGAAYVFEYSLGAWAQTAYLKASNPDASDNFGNGSVVIFGDNILVAAYLEDSNATTVNGNQTDNSALSAGAVYHFKYNTGNWSQTNYIKARNTNSRFRFGTLDASDNLLVVGASGEDGDSGAVYVFSKDSNGAWVQEARLTASNGEVADLFGFNVSVSGTTIAVGAQAEDSAATGINGNGSDNSSSGAGAVYIFEKVAGSWTQTAYIKPAVVEASDVFGARLDLDGDVLVVGAYGEDSNATTINGDASNNSALSAGAAYVFRRTAGVWAQEAYLKAPNTEAGDSFGYSVAVEGDYLAVGAYGEDSATATNMADNSVIDGGAVYVFKHTGGGTWTFLSMIKPTVLDADDRFGIVVDMDGDRLAIMASGDDSSGKGINGDPSDNSVTFSGTVHVYKNDGADNFISEAYLKGMHANPLATLAGSLKLKGDLLSFGSALDYRSGTGVNPEVSSSDLTYRSGSVSTFKRDQTNTWQPLVYLKAPNAGRSDRFGESSTIMGSEIFVGATYEDSFSVSNMFDESAPQKGAVYVYDLDVLLD